MKPMRFAVLAMFAVACATTPRGPDAIHEDALVIDTHEDVPLIMGRADYDFGQRSTDANITTDLPRLEAGGIDAVFFSVWTPATEDWTAMNGRAHRVIRRAICAVRRHPDRAAMAASSDNVRRIASSGRRAVLLGLEGGHALMNSFEELRRFRAYGVRYVTLTHDRNTDWADAALDRPRWGGLNDQGRAMIAEMNRLAIIPDLTHASDETFFDAVEISRGPVILSHHGVRGLVDNPMNASDEMLDALRRNGGVISILFFDPQINRALTPELMAEAYRRIDAQHGGDRAFLWDVLFALIRERNLPPASVVDVVDQIDYVSRRIGVGHVGIGSDYAGGAGLPGLEDISRLPALTAELVRRGYRERDIRKILGGNVMRVLAQAEALADPAAIAAAPAADFACP